MMRMKNPPHPGEILYDEIIACYGLTPQQSAKMLDMSAEALINVLNTKAKITPEIAYRLELAGICTAELWLAMQADYDLAQLYNSSEEKPQVDVQSFKKLQEKIAQQNEIEENEIDRIAEENTDCPDRTRHREGLALSA